MEGLKMDRKVVVKEIVFNEQTKINEDEYELILWKTKYSDGTYFYWLDDGSGVLKIWYASDDISELIKQIQKELRLNKEAANRDYNKDNLKFQERYKKIQEWKTNVLNRLIVEKDKNDKEKIV